MEIVTGRRGEPHVTSRQMQAVYRSFLGDFALLDIGNHLGATATANDNVRISDGVVAVQGIYAVIAYNEYDDNYIEPVSVGMKRIDTLILHYTKSNDIEDMQIEVVEGEEVVDNPVAPTIAEGGDAWEGTADIKVPIYDVLVTSFGLTVTPYSRMNTLIPTLDSIAERIPEHVVTGVKGDSEESYRYGNVNLTKGNIGLGNVDNTADTDKPISTATQTALDLKASIDYVNATVAAAYHAGGNLTVAELTSSLLVADNMGKVYNMSDSGVTTSDFVEGAGKPIREGDDVGICNRGTVDNPIYKFNLLSGFVDLSAYVTTTAMNTALADKVDKEAGKGLSTEDYTTEEKTKLAGIEAQANKTVVDSSMSTTSTNPLQNKVITSNIKSIYKNGAKNLLPLTVDNMKSLNTYGTWSGNEYTRYGIKYTLVTDNDGNITKINVKGTSTNGGGFQLSYGSYDSGNYILNGCPSGGGYSTYYIKSGNSIDIGSGISATSYDNVYIYIESGVTIDKDFYPMIRLASDTDSTFQPYSKTNQQLTADIRGIEFANGNPITVTDAAPVNAVDVSVDIEPIQDLHGYGNPWAGGAGKNKLSLNELGYSTTSSFSVDTDNSCHFIAPLSDFNSINRVSVKSIVQSGVNYTISAQQIDSGARIAIEKNNTAILTLKNGVLSDSLNVEYIESDSLELVIFNNLQISQDAYVDGLQIEQGSTATDFAPYSNICPISGRSEVEIDRVGKNLWDETYPDISNSVYYKSIFVGDGQFTLSTTTPKDSNNNTNLFLFAGEVTSGGSSAVNGVSVNNPKTVTSINGYVTIGYRLQYGVNPINYNTQLEKGTTATTYEPYAGKTYTIQFGQTVYGAHVDATKGELVVDKGIVNPTTVSSKSSSTTNDGYYLGTLNDAKAPSSISELCGIICNEFEEKSTEYLYRNDAYGVTINTNKELYIFLGKGNVTTVSEANTWLSNNPLQVCYELATPITIPLTPQQIKLLENTNTLYTDYEGDTIHIEYQPNNAIGEAVRVVEESYDAIIQNLLERIEALENNE